MSALSHGHSATHIHWIWQNMKQRCSNPRHTSYKDYGGRGIKVCPEWETFSKFLVWSQDNGYRKGLSLERKNNDEGYSPDNCCWSTRLTQNRNSRHNRVLTAFGETKSAIEWSEDTRCNTTYTGLRKRLNRGWSPELAITTPQQTNQFR